MARQSQSTMPEHGEGKPSWDERVEDLAWAVLLIAAGIILLLPSQRVPQGIWLVAAGTTLLALNAARYIRRRAISVFTSVLGVIALAGGVGDLAGIDLPLLALTLIALGAIVVLKPLIPRRSGGHGKTQKST
jgi:hypothetical protein